jgi:hypothetical protein
MKQAWEIKDDDGHAIIAFVDDNLTGDDFWDYVESKYDFYKDECTRERTSFFDMYSDIGHVPINILIEEYGWWFECCECGKMIDSDCEGYFPIKDNVYCSKECRQKRIDRIAKRKKDQEDFEIAIITLFPLVEFEFETYDNFVAYFKLPGMKHEGSIRKSSYPGVLFIEFLIAFEDLKYFKSIRNQYKI